MSYIRHRDTRGLADFGWLKSRHSFSFGSWYDPQYMGESVLRVINDDQVQPGAGFGTHGHRDMEIVSYVLQGTMAHRDSMGHVQRIEAGEFQIMSAGTGVTHSEFNASDKDGLNFLQIWIYPDRQGLPPSYQQKTFAREDDRDGRRLILSPDGRDGSLQVHQDMCLYLLRPQAGEQLQIPRSHDRVLYLHQVKGELELGDAQTLLGSKFLTAGDALFLDDGDDMVVRGGSGENETLLFDLPRV